MLFLKNSNNKKSQIIIISSFILISFILFIYYQETDNFYINSNINNDIINNIKYETCKIGKISNGSYIDSRFSNFSKSIWDYCQNNSYTCNLTIVNVDGETNESILSYKNYSYHLEINRSNYNYNSYFKC